MYSKYEKPIIKASIFYYDIEYSRDTAIKVLQILEKYNMYPPEKICADLLTNNKFICASEQTKDLFVQAYSEKGVLGVDMASGNSRKVADYWRVNWGFTFYKEKKLAVKNPKFMPWNVLSIHSTHGRLNDNDIYLDYLNCVKELIVILNPFYASIDDIDNKVKLLNQTREPHFVPNSIQQIYWGNYFGEQQCLQYGLDKIGNNEMGIVEKIGKGILILLTDHVLEYDSKECKQNRNKIKSYLKLNNCP